MFKKQAQAEPQPAGMIADLRSEVGRLSMAVATASPLWNQYYALEVEACQLEAASTAPDVSVEQSVALEARALFNRRKMKVIEQSAEFPAAVADHQAANDALAQAIEALRNAEYQARQWQQSLAEFDLLTRKICQERDYWRQRKVAEMNRFIGGPTAYPPVLDLNTIE